ncbi:plasminogen-like [Ptychodera flava]|uniref:plasminogen-like n=1 Tax=Ptychodera flava TaxID=63121 RepID=UPI00396A527F
MCKLPILLLQLVLSGYVLSSKMHSLKVSRNRETPRNIKAHQERRSEQNEGTRCYHSQDGSDYRGTVSTTNKGLPCLKWTEQSQEWPGYSAENYPYGGLGEHNYCRNLPEMRVLGVSLMIL